MYAWIVAALLLILPLIWFLIGSQYRVRRPLLQSPGQLVHALPIYWLENVISQAEADHLLAVGKPLLDRSRVQGDKISADRTSSTAYLDEDLTIQAIKNRLAALCNYPVSKFERLQLVHYAPGQQYRPHHDYLQGKPRDRHVTFFIYLDNADGATHFPNLDLSIQPKANCAAMWYNVDEKGNPDPRTLHAGLPPTMDKYGINVWIGA